MMELKYKMNEDGMKRLIETRIKKDKDLKNGVRKRTFVIVIIAFVMLFILNRKHEVNLIKSIIALGIIFSMFSLALVIVMLLNNKLIARKFFRRTKLNRNIEKIKILDTCNININILALIMIYIMTRKDEFNIMELLISMGIMYIMVVIFFAIIVWLNDKFIAIESEKRFKAYLDKEFYIQVHNENITFAMGSYKYECDIVECSILSEDKENVYIMFTNGEMTYVPKNIFKDEKQIDAFIDKLEE